MILDDLDLHFRGKGLGFGRIYREPDLLGALDTEVLRHPGEKHSKPYTLQVAIRPGAAYPKGLRELHYLNGNSKLARLCLYEYVDALPENGLGYMGFYYFKYDIQALFLDKPEFFTGTACLEDEVEHGFHLQGVLTWPTVFLKISKNGKKLIIADFFRFFEGGLDKVCRDLNLKLSKLPAPKCIKTQTAPRSENEKKVFEAYAMRDVDAGLQIAEVIYGQFQEHSLPPKISAAHMYYSIFKNEYTKNADGKPVGLDVPDILMQHAALKSYHGGRNSLTIPDGHTLPYIRENCSLFDVSSMYPFCGARKLDSFFGGEWVWMLSMKARAINSKPSKINGNGLYKISGELFQGKAGPYRLLMNHAGDYLPEGSFRDVWLCGVELKALFKYDMIHLKEILGFQWEPREAFYQLKGWHPFREYMEHYYKEKSEHKGKEPVLYESSKKALNTVYGKLIATIPHERFDSRGNKTGEIFHTPGSGFNAPVGSLFTAHSRVIIFESEIKYGSLHAATDSILLPGPDFPAENHGIMGSWEKECQGEFVVGRNKLYAIIDHDVTKKGFTGFVDDGPKRFWYWQGRRIHKYALHAFQGNVVDFLEAVFKGKTSYTARRMGNIRESLRRPDVVPLQMAESQMAVSFKGKYGSKSKEASNGKVRWREVEENRRGQH